MSEGNKLAVACCLFRGTYGTPIYITREQVRTPRPALFAHIDQTKGPRFFSPFGRANQI
jgi:hypothetical protein